MMKKILVIIIVICSTNSLSVLAQSIEHLFINMPDSTFALTKNNRADCIDFMKSKMKAVVENKFNEKSEMTIFNSNLIKVELSKESSWQMKLLPINDSTKIIAVIETNCAPACDSSIHFYSEDWKTLNSYEFISLPQTADFIRTITSEKEQEEWEKLERYLDMTLLKIDFNDEENEISVVYTTPSYLDKERAEEIAPFLIPKIEYIWENQKFVVKH